MSNCGACDLQRIRRLFEKKKKEEAIKARAKAKVEVQEPIAEPKKETAFVEPSATKTKNKKQKENIVESINNEEKDFDSEKF